MNLHIFNDPHGFYLNAILKRFEGNVAPGKHAFINLNDDTIHKNENVRFLKKSLKAYSSFISQLPQVESVHFYPLDFAGAAFLHLLRKTRQPKRVSWIFWSYELYHDPAIYPKHLDEFSIQWAGGLKPVQKIRSKIVRSIKKILQVPVYDRALIMEARRQVTHFYSVLKEDYLNAYPEGGPEWSRIALYSIDDVAESTQPSQLRKEIMIGHASTVPSNHETIIRKISEFQVHHPIFIPLEYGDLAYREHIKKVAGKSFPGKVSFLESRLSLGDYYKRLSVIGFAVFNFKFQEGVANISFLIWSGAKVFLSEQSTPYKEFKNWGLKVFSFENELTKETLEELLSEADRLKNKEIIESYVGEEVVAKYWDPLLL